MFSVIVETVNEMESDQTLVLVRGAGSAVPGKKNTGTGVEY